METKKEEKSEELVEGSSLFFSPLKGPFVKKKKEKRTSGEKRKKEKKKKASYRGFLEKKKN